MLAMSSQTAPATEPLQPHSVGFNLTAIAVLVLLLAVGAAYLVDELGRTPRRALPSLSDDEPISQSLVGRELAIPARWFRHGEQFRPGFTSQIDLRLMFSPASGTSALPVDVTLQPRSRARTSASLLDSVYLHQFKEETVTGVPGLVGKPMGRSSGYQGETVWYDALSPNPFVAKCVAPVAADAPWQCIRTVYLASGIAATYVFDEKALQSWRLFDAEMQRWLDRIGAL
ncbi:MAG: hypothetical protein JWP99_62 [Devosia sp.]|nr:hypothetical protein [Devosia sp.]